MKYRCSISLNWFPFVLLLNLTERPSQRKKLPDQNYFLDEKLDPYIPIHQTYY
jgi:hypothetical protein